MSELEKLTLPRCGRVTTRVGFGCSNLLGDKTREAGLELLHAAYDAGVRHFDVARVYNFGDAEAIVGEFAAGKRDEITIATKFGKAPHAGVARMKAPVHFARHLMRASPWLRRIVRRNVGALTQDSQFVPARAQASLEASLRALKTDVIDVFLLHEGTSSDCTDDILTFLLRVQAEGKIRGFGCGSGFEAIPAIAKLYPDFLTVAQFESDLLRGNVEAFQSIRPTQNELIVTHGSLGCATRLRDCFAENPHIVKRWSDRLGVDLGHGASLYGLLLQHALAANPGGQVLFRASTPGRIRASLSALQQLPLSPQTAQVMGEVGSLLRGAPTEAELGRFTCPAEL